MNDAGIFTAIADLVEKLVDQMWQLVARVFDLTRHIGPVGSGLIVVAVCSAALGVAWAMQRRLNTEFKANPGGSVSLLFQELRFSLPVIAAFIAALPAIGVSWLAGNLGELLGRSESASDDPAGDPSEEPASVVVATIGPSFMWAGLIVAGLYLLGWAIEPLLRYQLDLSAGYPAWQYLAMGDRLAMQWYLPLDQFPYLGALVVTGVWMTIWWWAARIVRVVLGSELGQNLADHLDDAQILASWRTWFGARKLWRTDESYRAWSMWLPIVAAPFLLWSWGTLSGQPYRMDSSRFAVGLVLWLSWVLQNTLTGHHYLVDDAEETDADPEPPAGNGWTEVVDELRGRHGIDPAETYRSARPVGALKPASNRAESSLVSPLLFEVLPADLGDDRPRLTHMQQEVLETLSLQAYVHLDPPRPAGKLELGRTCAAGISDASGLGHRNQVVLAPEAYGKTTLAMLAACNHALIHTRTTLVVTRDESAARQFCQRCQNRLEPSTLRWTVRVRQAGSSLVSDLSQGITPEVIVTSLRQLVVGMLDEPRSYAAFLDNLGLVVVDDVQTFCGPVELHMQLAFRRLTLRIREVSGGRQLGEGDDRQAAAPSTLVLGMETMHQTPAWAKTLCGIDAVTRIYGGRLGVRSTGVPPGGPSAPDDHSDQSSPQTDSAADTSEDRPAQTGRAHHFHRLSDFGSNGHSGLSIQDIVDACERLSVPWHYRQCGDAHRRDGRQALRLDREPECNVASPLDAAVVFLEGHVGAVRRETDLLQRAGARFDSSRNASSLPDDSEPIALISIVDPDEQAALNERRPTSELAEVIDTLPRPVVRAPFGRAVEAHLSADLVDTWMEIADIIDVFGHASAAILRRLAETELLAHQSHTDLDSDGAHYEDKVYVRVPAKAVAGQADAPNDPPAGASMAPKVSQVERPSGESVAIRDRTNLTIIDVTDRISARHVYYPGRIFESARGRYVVVGAASTADSDEPTVSDHDILVEPFLNDDVSSPRRRTSFRPLAPHQTVPGAQATDDPSADHRAADRIDAEPIFIGDYPLAISLGPIECTSRHLATVRLHPSTFAVRQRLIEGFDGRRDAPNSGEGSSGKSGWASSRQTRLQTVALGIVANPPLDIVDTEACPRLRLPEARLIAASIRAILPAMYRGSDINIQVALHLEADHPAADHVLGAQDGFYLYDPHLGGTGAARAIRRDGVELLMRLCRRYLQRVTDYERLRARYDFWAGADELVGHGARNPDAGPIADRAIAFLNSRLRPEAS